VYREQKHRKKQEGAMRGWAATELQFADLGDKRRNKRLVPLVADLAVQPHASVPQASGDWAATQAAYEFWSSPHIKAQAIAQAHQKSTLERVKQHSIVIAIQDTTQFNFTHHPSKKGMGYLDNANSRGLKVHSVLCSSGNGVPLGVLHDSSLASRFSRVRQETSTTQKTHSRQREPTLAKCFGYYWQFDFTGNYCTHSR
jgi:hypothetical protein